MLKNILEFQYGIQADEELRIGEYTACRKQEKIYILIPVDGYDDSVLNELHLLSEHLVKTGEKYCSTFLKTKEGKNTCEWQNGKYAILNSRQIQNRKISRLGRKLAKFHYRGRLVTFQVEKISRIGQWKQLWEQRLEQMEAVWNEMLFQHPDNEFERMFFESFPYYRGLAENAIQYLVDSELDDDPGLTDHGTVCHERLTAETWMNSYYMKNPFQWVFDHSARDLAEWTRERYFRNIKTYEPDLRLFLQDYQSIVPLTSFSWRLLYARLVFPLHYFNCIETYYGTGSEQKQRMLEESLQKYLQQTDDHEHFLASFYDFAEVPVKKMKIPIISWL